MDGLLREERAAAEPTDAPDDQRREYRKAFLKRAQIVFNGAGIDCIVENMSEGGARIRLGTPIALPDVVSLRFNDGTSYSARRRWSRGTVVGIQFDGEGPGAEAGRRHLAQALRAAVDATDPAEAMRLLRQVWFFGDEDLRRAAEAVEVARARLDSALSRHIEGRPAATFSVAVAST